MSTKKLNWFQIAFQLRQSVIPQIMPQVLTSGVFGIFVSLLYYLGLPVSLPILSALVPSIVLGLLLVFRTNTAYERLIVLLLLQKYSDFRACESQNYQKYWRDDLTLFV